MFKHADPNRRLPMYLQDRTVENVIWQLKLLVVVGGVVLAYDYIKEKRTRARWSRETTTS